MPNGNDLIEELSFDELIKSKTDRELNEFTARKVYDICEMIETHSKQIATLEDRDRRTFGLAGGVGGGVAAVLGGAIIVVLKHFGVNV